LKPFFIGFSFFLASNYFSFSQKTQGLEYRSLIQMGGLWKFLPPSEEMGPDIIAGWFDRSRPSYVERTV
jgi:hypothetical protein